MHKKIELSIIIVHYKAKKELFACLDSVKTSVKKLPYEIIVVDNDEEKTIEEELKMKYPGIVYVPNKNNGWGGGTNAGVKHAKGEYIYFLNPDTKIRHDAINRQYDFIRRHSEAGVVSSTLVDKDGNPYPFMGTASLTPLYGIFAYSFLNKLLPDNPFSRIFWLKDRDKDDLKPIDVVALSASIMRKDDFQKVGEFDEKMFMYFEEYDLSNKLNKLGRKNYVLPNAKVYHAWGVSSKEREDISEIFMRSRFYYFKKYFGWGKAVITEALLRISPTHVLLTVLFLLGLLLRVYRLAELMPFIGDQGWFYLSARDMLTTGHVPLIGIPSSHTWLHQGPLWTYILAGMFAISHFSPVFPGFTTAFIDSISIILIYGITKQIFTKYTGIIAASLYTTSPLLIIYSRMPYHTSLLSVLSLLLFYSLYRIERNNQSAVPLTFFLMGLLYNFELITQIFWLPVLGLLIYKSFFAKTRMKLKIRTIYTSVIAFLIPMIPIILYDISHEFKQTVIFAGWIIFHGFRSFLGVSSGGTNTYSDMFHFLLTALKRLIFLPNGGIALALFTLAVILFFYSYFLRKTSGKILLAISLFCPLIFIVANKTPSEAYLPMILPFILMFFALAISSLINSKRTTFGVICLLVLLGMVNSVTMVKENYFVGNGGSGYTFKQRMSVAKQITLDAQGLPIRLAGKGPGSQFTSFTMNYEYLIWYLGGHVVRNNELIIYTIHEKPSGIFFDKIRRDLAFL